MGRQPTFRRIHSDNNELNRLQDALQEALTPVLGNPLFGSADFRLAEVAGSNPSITPTFALQYRTPGTQQWVTVATFGSNGDLSTAINLDLLQTPGDTIYASSKGVAARLPPGSNGQVLTLAAGLPAWAAAGGSGQVDFIQTRRWGGYTPSGTVLNALLQFGIQTPTFVGTGPTAQPFSERDTVQFTAAAAAAAVGGMQGPFTETRPFFRPKVSCIFIFDNRVGHNTNARVWFGLASSALSGLAPKIGSAASAIHFIGLAYDATVSPNFIIDSGDGTNHSGIDSGYAVPAGLNYFMVTLDWTSNGSLAWSISAEPFQSGAYNQALEAWTLVASGTKSTNLSSLATQDLGVVFTVTSSGATTGNLNLGKLMLEQN